MKTTLRINDVVMSRLKREAARQGRTMSDIVESSLRATLWNKPANTELPPLPTFKSGGFRVDISDRDALFEIFDREKGYIRDDRKT